MELETEHSDIIFKAILPEMQESISERYTGKLKRNNGKITFEIDAKDIIAFRAALNAYLRWVKAICDICEFVKGGT
ncbi:MAG: KEOPS complex subunit Pcc1 [Candidatus Jordarchaeales archaeon]